MKSEKAAGFVVKQEAYDSYNEEVSKAVVNTVWATGGCDSWYIDKTGKPNLYPWHPRQFYKEMEAPDFGEYRIIDEIEAERHSVESEAT